MGKKSKKKQFVKEMSDKLGMNVAKLSKTAKRNNKLTPCAVKSKNWEVSNTYFNPFKKSLKMDGGYVDPNGKEVAAAIGKSYMETIKNAKAPEEVLEKAEEK